MTTLLFVRHGFSVTNKSGKFTGQLDVPLAEVGELQAQQVSKYIYDNFEVDALYSSDSQRAVNTISPLADALGKKINLNKNLRELDVGKWQGEYVEDVKNNFAQRFADYQRDPWNNKCDGGESFEDMYNRAIDEIEKIVADNEDKTVVIATHGGVIKVLRCVWSGIDTSLLSTLEHVSNASLTIVKYIDNKYILENIGYDKFLTQSTGKMNLN